MKNQALFSSKDEVKKLKCHLLQILHGSLRVNLDKISNSPTGYVLCGRYSMVLRLNRATFQEL